jgi:hypothetical protein
MAPYEGGRGLVVSCALPGVSAITQLATTNNFGVRGAAETDMRE